jgi:hypothetical protein
VIAIMHIDQRATHDSSSDAQRLVNYLADIQWRRRRHRRDRRARVRDAATRSLVPPRFEGANMAKAQNDRTAVSVKQRSRLGPTAWVGLVACGVLFGFLVVVWSGVHDDLGTELATAAEPSAAVGSPEATAESPVAGEQHSAFATLSSTPTSGAPSVRPRPIATRPPLENPGGVNGTRPARPIPGLRTR